MSSLLNDCLKGFRCFYENQLFRSYLLTAVGTIALVSCAIPFVHAAVVIDQQQLGNESVLANFNRPGLAQSFIPSYDNIVGAGIELFNTGGSGLITIALYDALPNNGGNLLATGSANGIEGSFVDVSFAQTAVTPGDTYLLVFTADNSSLWVNGSSFDPYANGQAYHDPDYSSLPTYDYTFQTFSNVTVVPEANTAVLLGIALPVIGAVAVVRRRRR